MAHGLYTLKDNTKFHFLPGQIFSPKEKDRIASSYYRRKTNYVS